MSKRTKSTVELPDIAHMDDLALLSDEELVGRAGRLEADRRRAASTMNNLTPWEVEIAYVRREQQLRDTRTQLHAEFLRGAPAVVVEAEEVA